MMRQNVTESGACLSLDFASHKVHLSDKLYADFEADTETLVVKWIGEVSSEEIKKGYAAILELIENCRPKKWIIDIRKREQIQKADQRWIFEHFFSKALRIMNCDIFLAVILPVYSYHGLISELNGDELINGSNLLVINHFLYEEEGRRWLDNSLVLN